MRNYNILSQQNDLQIKNELLTNKIKIIDKKINNYLYKTILFKKINKRLEKQLTNSINFYFKKNKLNNKSHIFVVGLGKDYHTADSIGPNTLKGINVNAYLDNFNIKKNIPKVSSLKPGVLGETGILTEKTIKSIVEEIHPDLVILVDSMVTDNINYLNHTIEINNHGINPGSGIFGINSIISKKTIHVPILVIGVVTSLLININNNKINYLLSTKDILDYINEISKVIASSINNAINNLKRKQTNR